MSHPCVEESGELPDTLDLRLHKPELSQFAALQGAMALHRREQSEADAVGTLVRAVPVMDVLDFHVGSGAELTLRCRVPDLVVRFWGLTALRSVHESVPSS